MPLAHILIEAYNDRPGSAKMMLPQSQTMPPPGRSFELRVEAARAAFHEGRLADALQLFSELTREFPFNPLPHADLGMTLRRMGRTEAAVTSYNRALALAPDDPRVMSILGNALRSLDRPADAEKLQARALMMVPDDRWLRYNYALTLRDMRKTSEALRILSDLHAGQPNDPEVAWDLAITQLQMGDYIEGFKGYEARWHIERNKTGMCEGPHWNGEEIAGKRILLQSEQGFGDAIQFVRYVPLVAACGARIVLECMPELSTLFANIPGVEEVVIRGTGMPSVDLSAPLLSLPRLFGTSLATIPTRVPYLQTTQKLMLPRTPDTNLRVGLIWAGKPAPRDRS